MTLVGKGVCFDTGGLDIKPAAGMLTMKKDMGGGAQVNVAIRIRDLRLCPFFFSGVTLGLYVHPWSACALMVCVYA